MGTLMTNRKGFQDDMKNFKNFTLKILLCAWKAKKARKPVVVSTFSLKNETKSNK